MKKSIVLKASVVATVALLFINFQLKAQSGDSHATRLGIGFNIGAPTTDGYDLSLGGDVRLQKDFSGNVSGILTAGYTNFSLDGEESGSVGFIPLKAGLKVFPLPKLYISGELGAGFGTDDGQKTAFIWSPGIGYGLNNGLDLGARYEEFSRDGGKVGHVAFRIAYGFPLR